MNGISKVILKPSSLLFAFLFLGVACETTGDLRKRSKSDSSDTGEIKTVENPILKPSANPDVERELAITRGRLLEIETLRDQERQAFEQQIQQLEKDKEQLLVALESIQNKQAGQPAPAVSTAPEKPSETRDGFKTLWDQAFAQVKAKNYDSSAALFEELVKRYPSRKGIFYAYIGQAFSLYSSGSSREAALVFNDTLDKFPQNKARSLATFGLGVSFVQLKKSKDAKVFFEEVKASAASTAHGKLSSEILAGKAKAPKDLFLALPKWYQ